MRIPPVVYGAVVALCGAAALVTFGSTVAGGVLVVVGLAIAALNEWLRAEDRRKTRDLAQRYLDLAAASADTPANRVRRDLGRMRFEPAYAADATRALEQLNALERSYDRFLELLGRRLQPGEMTYDRYAASGRKVFELVVLSLAAVCDKLPAVASERGSAQLTAGRSTALVVGGAERQHDDGERTPARIFVDELFRRNAVALDGFQKINAAIGSTVATRTASELASSMQDLADLERQLRRYGR